MRRAFALTLLLSSSLIARAAPDTPALQVFKQWLDAFNSANRAKISAFWSKYGQTPSEDREDRELQLRQMTGGMTIFRVQQDTGTHLVVLMKEGRGAWSESTLDLATADPLKIARITGHPVPAPAGSVPAAENDGDLADKVEQHVATLRGNDAFSGAILIAHKDSILLKHAWGLADVAKRIPNTVDTQFCLGSMNKMFTAVAILQLVQQGKLMLDKPIATYWPDYPNQDLATRVTIRQLLSHTGGTGEIFTPEYTAHRLDTRTLADYVKLYGKRPVSFVPGSRMEYSNYGFILLGRIIELTSGESYDDYVRKHIYLPAGMLQTEARPESELVRGRAIGYARELGVPTDRSSSAEQGPGGLAPNTDWLPWSGTSAGGGYSTVQDLLLFADALQRGKLLSPALLKEATTDNPSHPGYGLGFYVLPGGGYGHGGGAPGINAELHILPQRGYVVVALTNRDPRMATDAVGYIESILPQQAQRAAKAD
jgi:CubicO group peptidase (beta-lactamase class C family)